MVNPYSVEKRKLIGESGAVVQTFGEYDEELPQSQDGLMIEFSPSPIPLSQHKQIKRLSAQFLAEFMTVFLPVVDSDSETYQHYKEICGAVKFVAYELLENAIKFHAPSSNQSVRIQLTLYGDRLIFLTTNCMTSDAVSSFQTFIAKLLCSDLAELYVSQVESNAINQDVSCSKLGLLTLMLDYQVKLGWKFTPISACLNFTSVTTMAQLLL